MKTPSTNRRLLTYNLYKCCKRTLAPRYKGQLCPQSPVPRQVYDSPETLCWAVGRGVQVSGEYKAVAFGLCTCPLGIRHVTQTFNLIKTASSSMMNINQSIPYKRSDIIIRLQELTSRTSNYSDFMEKKIEKIQIKIR